MESECTCCAGGPCINGPSVEDFAAWQYIPTAEKCSEGTCDCADFNFWTEYDE